MVNKPFRPPQPPLPAFSGAVSGAGAPGRRLRVASLISRFCETGATKLALSSRAASHLFRSRLASYLSTSRGWAVSSNASRSRAFSSCDRAASSCSFAYSSRSWSASTGAQRSLFASDGYDGYATCAAGPEPTRATSGLFVPAPLLEAGACMGRAPASFRARTGPNSLPSSTGARLLNI
jgi:hypothetical protein